MKELQTANGRLLGLTGTTFVQAARREVRAALAAADGNRPRAIASGLDRLAREELISQPDRERLQVIADAIVAPNGERHAPLSVEVVENVRAIYHELVADRSSGPVAIAIASAVDGRLSPDPARASDGVGVVFARTTVSGGAAIIVGGMVGAVIGAEFGLVGAVAGAIAGSVVGGIAGECEISTD
jgi:hypothetical protein